MVTELNALFRSEEGRNVTVEDREASRAIFIYERP